MRSVKRLYREFQPKRYELHLVPNREKMTFSGHVKITGRKVGRPSKRLTFHQKDLKISSAKLTVNDKKRGPVEISVTRHNTHKSFDELRLHTDEILFPGEYVVEIEFSGRITEPMHGIYPCNFEYGGQKKKLIATQFESHHAREAFPCIDEPEAKAVFSLSLETSLDELVIANTPIKKQTKNDRFVTIFEDTPVMSTYLLAFAYGELGYKESKTKDGVKVRVYSTPDKVGLTAFALDVSVRALEFFEDYFGVKYPLAKLDVIGLPDFSAGAMENWGLVTFRESVLYAHPQHSSIETKQQICMVVCHELAHQWFGNLVTMRWWNDLWLNESFANLMEYRATDELFPEWKIWEEFTAREMGMALSRDSLPNVQPVRVDVHHPDELSAVFDPAIVYAKGGCLLNMVRNLVGETAFRAGLKTYFSEFKYQNTEADDLWRHLGRAGGFEVGDMMQTWLNKPGFPAIEIDYDDNQKTATLRQSRLVVGQTTRDQTSWDVPLSASWGLEEPTLNRREASIKARSAENYPLVLNHDAKSYFASKYSPGLFREVLKSAASGQLNTVDRLLLVQSYLLLERAGHVMSTDNLELFRAFSSERDEAVWSVLGGIIAGARTLIGRDEKLEDQINGLIRPSVSPITKELGWDANKSDDSHRLKLRALALSLSAAAKDEAVIKEGLKRLKELKQPSDISPDIRTTVYFIGVRYGSSQDFTKLLNLYKKLNNADEKDEIAMELCATREPDRIKQLLALITSDYVRLQDAPTWFAWLMRNRYATDLAWQWLQDNWQWVRAKYSSDKSYDRFPRYAAMAFSYPEQLDSYKEFFLHKSNTALERPVKLGIEEIEGRLAWRAKNEQAVKNWLVQLG